MFGGRQNPRQMQAMMRQLGMTTEPLDGVEEVVIRTRDKEHVLSAPEVTILTIKGVRTYQVIGNVEVRPRGASSGAALAGAAAPPAAPAGPPEEDVSLVMEQANVPREEAVSALMEANGAPAEAILLLLSRRGADADER